MSTYSDEYIEFWAGVFLANNLYERGILFYVFIDHPEEILAAVFFNLPHLTVEPDDYRPLLPKQHKVMCRFFKSELEELEAELIAELPTTGDSSICVRNGHYIEPLRHRAYAPRTNRSHFQRAAS
jgi:hypothetical protein